MTDPKAVGLSYTYIKKKIAQGILFSKNQLQENKGTSSSQKQGRWAGSGWWGDKAVGQFE